MTPRILYLDILRIIACVMVVFMHSQRPHVGIPAWFLSGSSYITAPCIGLFLMISGALILGKAKKLSEGQRFDTFSLLKHRLLKIVIPLAFWTLLYWLLSSIETSGLSVMWFLWMILGIYLLSPILVRWLQHATLQEVELYLGIWGITLVCPFVKLLFSFNEGDTAWFYYFHGYVGYFVLGYYLSIVPKERLNKYIGGFFILFFLFSLCAPIVVLLGGYKIDFYSLFWYLSLPVVLQCIVWFVGFRLLEEKLDKQLAAYASPIAKLSTMTYGIYLSHILVLRIGLWNAPLLSEISGIPYMFICAAITLPLAWSLTWILGKMPRGKCIIGI